MTHSLSSFRTDPTFPVAGPLLASPQDLTLQATLDLPCPALPFKREGKDVSCNFADLCALFLLHSQSFLS